MGAGEAVAIAAGFMTASTLMLVLLVFRQPIAHWLKARRHRRESVSHPRQPCKFCGGISTRLVLDSQVGLSPSYRCKDRALCIKTRRLKKLLDSTP